MHAAELKPALHLSCSLQQPFPDYHISERPPLSRKTGKRSWLDLSVIPLTAMKLILQSADFEVQASAIKHAEDVAWFRDKFKLQLVSTTEDLSCFVRDAGVKRMRFTKPEEKALGEFVRGEYYTDGFFEYYFVIFSKGAALLAGEEATTSCILGYLQHVGLSEKEFEKNPEHYLELLGYRGISDSYTLEEAGLKSSLKALHGKLDYVRKYALGSDHLYVARFKTTTVVQFGSEDQLIRIHTDLAMIYSADRLERHVNKLLGQAQHGRLQVKLLNGESASMSVDRAAPGWAVTLHEMSLQAGGGFLNVDLAG